MHYLIRGDDYLAKMPNFKLVGREAELKKLSSILIRSKANSVLLVGPGGVGCTALCMGLQDSKKDPNAPFDSVNKRIFWLDTDGMFWYGNSTRINDSIHNIMNWLNVITKSILTV